MSAVETSAPPAPGLLGNVRLGLIVAGVALSGIGALAMAAGPLLYRMGAMPLEMATAGIESAALIVFVLGLIAAGGALATSLLTKKQRGVIVATACVIASGYGAGRLYGQAEIRRNMPPLWDIQTDWTQPIAFSPELTAARAAVHAPALKDDAVIASKLPQWSGKTFAAAQAEAYQQGDTNPLKPLTVDKPVAETTAAAAKAMADIGWKVTKTDPAAGVVEATETTAWYGLTADIVVRVRPEGTGSRIDVRSTSREAVHDMGANAQRATALIEQLNFALRGSTEGD